MNDGDARVTNGHQSGLWSRDNETHCSSPSQTLLSVAESENDCPAPSLASLAEPFNNSGSVMDVDEDSENPVGNESIGKNLLVNSCKEDSVCDSVTRGEDYSCCDSIADGRCDSGGELVTGHDDLPGDSAGLRMDGSSDSLMRIPGATEKDSPSRVSDLAAEGLFL